jgi:dGTPase
VADPSLYHATDYSRALEPVLGKGEKTQASWRSPFRRDYARLVHSASFRRLQGKTQLFAGLESDFFRNRLTHSLEVAQIAKGIALKLNREVLLEQGEALDLDLVEFAALAHDLGHPPFGHTGEEVLDDLMRDAGGFEGNAQTLRILARLEKKLDHPTRQMAKGQPRWYEPSGEDAAIGLNVCSRSLASILKYDREIPRLRKDGEGLVKGHYGSEEELVEKVWRDVLPDGAPQIGRRKVVECQIMDVADDIAYSTYDLEDAFKAGLLTPLDLITPEDKVVDEVAQRVTEKDAVPADQAVVRDVLQKLFRDFAHPESRPPKGAWRRWYLEELTRSYTTARTYAESGFLRTALTSALVDSFIGAVELRLDEATPQLSGVDLRDEERLQVAVLKHLAYVLLISTSRMRVVAHRASGMVRHIFEALSGPKGEDLLPPDVAERHRQADDGQKPRVICDFIAGMTDRYAVELYARLTSETFYSMFKPH